ncbi:MAG TPA: hypothetical protein DCQ26_08770 [Marinilabiliales bacterium]|nr:MAG: hypothetical protein A2W84_03690 [Bacteroidetes bacterium GWC2_40_13]OFX75814.1 MAG: hypothetical protein A2W96_09645 [Bacteroidetes bacterium GWD2_40_43]OFX94913.1 MAG: hypothetical protein A2W97_16195 [Bacteroidetes bacterium GWE2_40_63]OFY23427.1 MAG: hypothetical protein A2W88_08005 [Bacteroidetes bacterium GWF2_40_13]OFZ29446.1 MAG: hypothetical protein A2437_09590 [Bacteroidetes bacterium RIFOXYC2_FULL_40_12]HAM98693.1 hypothetical protein [Marinilabiliales bacterium]
MKLVNAFLTGFLLLSLVVFIQSCQNRYKEVVEETYQDGKAKIVKYYKGNGASQSLVREIQYYPNGSKKVEGTYKEGEKEGQWIFYFENGEQWSVGFFEKGLRTGKAKVYHENGKVFYTGEYVRGQKHGTWKFYNDEGELVNTTQFDHENLTTKPFTESHKHLHDSI